MLLKLVGSIAVIFSCSFIGYVLSRDFSRRPCELRDLQNMLHILENEISYLSNLLTDAFGKIHTTCESSVSVFFKDTVKRLKEDNGQTASEAWECAVRMNIGSTALSKEDEKVLVSFGRILGSSDIEGQMKNIKLTLKQLESQEKKAEQIRIKNEGIYRRLGVLSGIAIVIILL